MKISDDFTSRENPNYQQEMSLPNNNQDEDKAYDAEAENDEEEVNIESLKIHGETNQSLETENENEVVFNLTQSQNQIGDDIREAKLGHENKNVASSLNLKGDKKSPQNS